MKLKSITVAYNKMTIQISEFPDTFKIADFILDMSWPLSRHVLLLAHTFFTNFNVEYVCYDLRKNNEKYV